jgi:hypothetical protein
MKRPFWLHQVVDYILGIVLMAQASEAPKPLVPLIVGFLVLVNAACVDGPIAAFRGLARKHHRIVDILLLLVVFAVGISGYGLKSSNKVAFICVAVLWVVVILNSNYAEKVKRKKLAPDERSEAVGKMAGRAVAGGVNSWRRMKNSD